MRFIRDVLAVAIGVVLGFGVVVHTHELIDVVYPGTGFVAGDVGVVGGAGSGFAAVFGVDSTGGITEVNISGNGYGFLSRPDAVAYYPATQLEAAAAEDDESLSISAAGLGASGLAAEVGMQLLVGDEVVTVASVGDSISIPRRFASLAMYAAMTTLGLTMAVFGLPIDVAESVARRSVQSLAL